MSGLAWDCIDIPCEKLKSVAGEKDGWAGQPCRSTFKINKQLKGFSVSHIIVEDFTCSSYNTSVFHWVLQESVYAQLS